jgi:hypothetical protein
LAGEPLSAYSTVADSTRSSSRLLDLKGECDDRLDSGYEPSIATIDSESSFDPQLLSHIARCLHQTNLIHFVGRGNKNGGLAHLGTSESLLTPKSNESDGLMIRYTVTAPRPIGGSHRSEKPYASIF